METRSLIHRLTALVLILQLSGLPIHALTSINDGENQFFVVGAFSAAWDSNTASISSSGFARCVTRSTRSWDRPQRPLATVHRVLLQFPLLPHLQEILRLLILSCPPSGRTLAGAAIFALISGFIPPPIPASLTQCPPCPPSFPSAMIAAGPSS